MRKLIPKRIRTIVKNLIQWYIIALKRRMRSHPGENVLNCTIIYGKHGAYCIPSYAIHMPLARRIIKYGAWEKETTDFISANCGKGDVIHAGAFTGDILPQLSKAMHKDAAIWAFEASYQNYRYCKVTITINDITNVSAHNLALGDKEDNLLLKTFENGEDLAGTNHIITELGNFDTEMVRSIRIDETVGKKRHISIIHLDIEGYELRALRGGIETIRRCKPILVIEDNHDYLNNDWFKENILSLGYKYTQKVDGNLVFQIT